MSAARQSFIRRLVSVATAGLLVVGLIALPMPARAQGRTLYVAPWGNDFLANGWEEAPNSFEEPWGTLEMAFRRAEPGDTILVRGGTYVETVGWGARSGTKSSPITVKNFQGERVVLKGQLQLTGVDYWTIDGINVTYDALKGPTAFLVKFDGGNGWQLLNSEIWGTRGVSNLMVIESSKHGSPSNYRIAGNCIHDNEATGNPFMNDHNIYLQPGYGSGPGVIERNIIFGAPNGGNIKAAGSDPAKTGAANVLIRFNTLANAGAGVIVGYGSHHIDLRGNLIGPQEGGGQLYQAAVIGNTVSGMANTAVDTAVYGYEDTVWSTKDSTTPIAEARSLRVNPRFDSTDCSGFHPSDEAAAAFGRYGDGAFPSVGSDTFRDDDGSVFEADIEKVAEKGITRGCNPPLNDNFCPDDVVTRGQMAAFLKRGLELAAVAVDHFEDDDRSSFENDINALAEAEATKGCNPPINDRFCPDDPVTRGQMAAFLTRVFGYSPGSLDYFRDDSGSIFESEINALARSGVTKGCNPPANDLFCPNALITRGEMAAFLARALDL